MELRRSSTHEQLAAYLAAHHESLVAVLPPDTKCTDLFGEVDAKRPIAGFFNVTEDAAIGREFLRFTQMIELWLVEEQKKGKEKEKRDKADALRAARKESKSAKKQRLEPPKPTVMAFSDAQLVAQHAQEKREDSARERLLEKGYTASLRMPNGTTAPDHQKFFVSNPVHACELLGIEYLGEDHGMFKVHLPAEALKAFETAKRATKSKTSGKGKAKVVTPMPYSNYKLPLHGEIIGWQEFFGVLVAKVYKESDTAAFKILMSNSSDEIEVRCAPSHCRIAARVARVSLPPSRAHAV